MKFGWNTQSLRPPVGVKGTSVASILFISPTAITFCKLFSLGHYAGPESFGRYSLYALAAAFLTYGFNSGLYEGSLLHFAMLLREGRFRRVSLLLARIECFSFLLFLVVLSLISALVLTFDFQEKSYVLATIVLAYSNAHFNLSTTKNRANNDLVAVGSQMLGRAGVSTTIAYLTFAVAHTSLPVVFASEAGSLLILNLVGVQWWLLRSSSLSAVLKVVFKMASSGLGFCYMSSLKNGIFLLERLGASWLLSTVDFGRYSRGQLVYQAISTLGGVVAQTLQQKILMAGLSEGVGIVGLNLIRAQQRLLLTVGTILVFATMMLSWSNWRFGLEEVFGGVGLIASCMIVISALLNGSNYFDSLALAAKQSRLFVICGLAGVVTWFGLWLIFGWHLRSDWSIGYQAGVQLCLALCIFFSNVAFSRTMAGRELTSG